MQNKRKYVTYGLVAAVLCLVAWAASARPQRVPRVEVRDPEPQHETQPIKQVQIPKVRPRVEIVFALDTTGSMSGLIDGAKRKIWSIAQFVANGQPKPDLRVGLVAYRDIGDDYVTRFYDLSDDLDEVFEHLSSFSAGGGGDTPEHVAKALHDAVNRTSWSSDQSVLRQIYLVGDAPPHTDYNDGYDYKAIAKKAHRLGIHVNTIRCGSDPATELAWQQISTASEGEYASIEQSGGVVVAATPYDDKLRDLNARLVKTAIGYGEGRAAVARKAASAAALPAPAAADRAAYYGAKGEDALGGLGDLVGASTSGRVDVDKVPTADLPAEMQAMAPTARRAYVAEKAKERKEVADEINKLAHDRALYLKKSAGPAKPTSSFDGRVEETIRKQGASTGLKF